MLPPPSGLIGAPHTTPLHTIHQLSYVHVYKCTPTMETARLSQHHHPNPLTFYHPCTPTHDGTRVYHYHILQINCIAAITLSDLNGL